jgi:hypothetical protein
MSTPTSDKIWRYMTLSKLISLLSSKAIYFACPSQFADPYEGFYPASHMRAFEPILQKAIDDSREARNKLASLFPYADLSNVDNALGRGQFRLRRFNMLARRRQRQDAHSIESQVRT